MTVITLVSITALRMSETIVISRTTVLADPSVACHINSEAESIAAIEATGEAVLRIVFGDAIWTG